ncbi:MAG TPA: head GIN domain-containing protein [Ohtaekwangia sp.]|uniref:head GIN domain-containing protein n=1 Tax=Ohtaekwangia sp. TaxID=2066019 RepID=UPI002F91DF88
MKYLLSIVFLITCLAGASAQQSQTRSVDSFSGIKVAEGVNVYLKKGDKESLRVEVSGTDPENVITEVSGSYLKVHMKDGRYRGSVSAKVYVTYVKLDKLSASSAGSIYTEEAIKGSSMDISASSAGEIEVALDVESVSASASSAGELTLTGKTKSLTVESSSAGEIDAYSLDAQKVQAEASSAGSIKISVSSELVAHASSGGSIRFRGNPNKSVTDSSSGGSVKKSS